jgi:hypothetical protein
VFEVLLEARPPWAYRRDVNHASRSVPTAGTSGDVR